MEIVMGMTTRVISGGGRFEDGGLTGWEKVQNAKIMG